MANESKSNALRWLFGLPFTAVGVFIIWSALTGQMNSSSDAVNKSPFLGIFVGLLFLIPGLWAFQLQQRTKILGNPESRAALFAGTLFLLMGIFIVIMSFVDDDAAFDAPRFIAAMAGSVFGFAGLFLIKKAVADKGVPNEKSLFNLGLLALLLTGFGSIATWVSLGAGERGFESSIGAPLISSSTEADEGLGRLCFLPGAIVLDAGASILWFHILRRLARIPTEGLRQSGDRRKIVFVAGAIVLMLAIVAIILAIGSHMQYLPGRQ